MAAVIVRQPVTSLPSTTSPGVARRVASPFKGASAVPAARRCSPVRPRRGGALLSVAGAAAGAQSQDRGGGDHPQQQGQLLAGGGHPLPRPAQRRHALAELPPALAGDVAGLEGKALGQRQEAVVG